MPTLSVTTFMPFITAALITAAIWLYVRALPRRDESGTRFALGGIVILAMTCVITWFAYIDPIAIPDGMIIPFQGALFAVIILIYVGITIFCFDTSRSNAIFCCAAGYTTQNIAGNLGSNLWELAGTRVASLAGMEGFALFAVAAALIVYPISYRFIAKRFARSGMSSVNDKRMLAILLLVMFIEILLDLVIKEIAVLGIAYVYILCIRLAQMFTCAFILYAAYEMLYNKQLQLEVATFDRMRLEQEHQLRLSKETIDAINIKCHDIRHQIRQLGRNGAVADAEALRQIEEQVSIYDSAVKTDNEALDIILTEKSLLCESQGITLSCIADGSALSGMAPSDLYALFGNALDNAIEAVERIDDTSKRSISLVVKRNRGMAVIHVENYFEGSVEMRDGLPITRKADKANHGFGTKSMRRTAQRYGGTLATTVRDGIFQLNIMLPEHAVASRA